MLCYEFRSSMVLGILFHFMIYKLGYPIILIFFCRFFLSRMLKNSAGIPKSMNSFMTSEHLYQMNIATRCNCRFVSGGWWKEKSLSIFELHSILLPILAFFEHILHISAYRVHRIFLKLQKNQRIQILILYFPKKKLKNRSSRGKKEVLGEYFK